MNNNDQQTDLLNAHCSKVHISPFDYRRDIDGLRALAVLSVVIFHAFPETLPGGFVGVDIFFVISGFLISKHIFENLESENFSFKDFYARRIKRIFPALTLVLSLTILIGWLLLTPDEYKQLGRHIAGGASFSANFIFWKQAGYFDTAADTKPLLHLWSLAIEEQFYILWPLLAAIVWRYAKGISKHIIFLLAIASLLYSAHLVQKNPVADFYSPLTRSWELILGALITLIPNSTIKKIPAKTVEALSAIGLGLIGIALFYIDQHSRFPGLLALLPTIGAALIILCGQNHRAALINSSILSSRPFVFIGLISYPIYLWHWPLLSFARIAESAQPEAYTRLILIILSIALAWGTYRYIELPIRSYPKEKAHRIVTSLALSMLTLCVFGLVIKHFDGFKFRALSRLDGQIATIVLGADRGGLSNDCGVPALQNSKDMTLKFCKSNGNSQYRYAVMGDSKAEALYYGLAREISFAKGVLIGSVRPPLVGPSANARKNQIFELALNSVINDPTIKIVIYVIALRDTFSIDEKTGFITGETNQLREDWLNRYSNAIKRLEQSGKRVVFVIDNPTLPDPRSCISGGMTSSDALNLIFRRKPNPKCDLKYTDHIAGTQQYLDLAKSIKEQNPNLLVYDPTSLLCDISSNSCSIKSKKGEYYYSYSDHISDFANSLIARDLAPKLEAMLFSESNIGLIKRSPRKEPTADPRSR